MKKRKGVAPALERIPVTTDWEAAFRELVQYAATGGNITPRVLLYASLKHSTAGVDKSAPARAPKMSRR